MWRMMIWKGACESRVLAGGGGGRRRRRNRKVVVIGPRDRKGRPDKSELATREMTYGRCRSSLAGVGDSWRAPAEERQCMAVCLVLHRKTRWKKERNNSHTGRADWWAARKERAMRRRREEGRREDD